MLKKRRRAQYSRRVDAAVCVRALQMCVCVCALQMCVCVCALQMCVCFRCVCVHTSDVCVRFRCVFQMCAWESSHTVLYCYGNNPSVLWRFSTAWYGTVRFGTVHFWGVFHWVLYLVPGTFLVPPQPRFQASRTVTKT